MQAYIETDQQIHLLCQIIAKANRTFVKARADDSHTNLYFDPLADRIYGHWIESPAGRIILALNLSVLQFAWLDASLRELQHVSVAGRLMNEIERQLAAGMDKLGLNPAGFTQKLHFEIPNYGFTAEPIRELSQTGVAQWRFFRALANDAAAALLGHLQFSGEVRIWPHHFDTGIYAQLSKTFGLGFGLAMADSLVTEPYFYLTGYTPQPIEYSDLPDLNEGKWKLGKHWQGSCLALDHLPYSEPRKSRRLLDQFLLASSDWYLKNQI